MVRFWTEQLIGWHCRSQEWKTIELLKLRATENHALKSPPDRPPRGGGIAYFKKKKNY